MVGRLAEEKKKKKKKLHSGILYEMRFCYTVYPHPQLVSGEACIRLEEYNAEDENVQGYEFGVIQVAK